MGYAILRTQKLKSVVAVRRSMKHAFREQDTPNADQSRLQDNTHIGALSADEGLAKVGALLPVKRRSDAVLCVEYLVTGSPEALAGKSRAEQDAYLQDALAWIKERHGAANVVYAGIHRDEATPHLYAYAVPLDPDTGRLNAKRWLGGARALSEMQTEFADRVGRRHGLQRGIEGSKARHTTVRDWYAQVERTVPVPAIDVPEAGLIEGREKYGQRVAQAVIDQIQPERSALIAQAATARTDRKRADEMAATAKAAQTKLAAVEPLVQLGKESPKLLQKLVDAAQEWRGKLAAQRAAGGKAKDQARTARTREEGPER